MQCKNCKNENVPEAKFCMNCGCPLKQPGKECQYCQRSIPEAARFCPFCNGDSYIRAVTWHPFPHSWNQIAIEPNIRMLKVLPKAAQQLLTGEKILTIFPGAYSEFHDYVNNAEWLIHMLKLSAGGVLKEDRVNMLVTNLRLVFCSKDDVVLSLYWGQPGETVKRWSRPAVSNAHRVCYELYTDVTSYVLEFSTPVRRRAENILGSLFGETSPETFRERQERANVFIDNFDTLLYAI